MLKGLVSMRPSASSPRHALSEGILAMYKVTDMFHTRTPGPRFWPDKLSNWQSGCSAVYKRTPNVCLESVPQGVELRRMMYANPILPQRSHRRPVVLDRTTLARLSGRTASQDRSARRRRCHLLHPPGRLPVALPPQGFPPQEHRLEILRPVATQRHARNDPRPAPPQGPRGAEALLAPDLGERRQPVGRHHLGRRAAGPGQRQGRRWQETPYRRGQHGLADG